MTKERNGINDKTLILANLSKKCNNITNERS